MVKKSSFVSGFILLLIGVILLLNRLEIAFMTWEYTYPILLLAMGILFIVIGFFRHDSGSAFWGTLFLLLGIFFFLRNFLMFSFEDWYWEELWPLFLIIPGLSFIVMFIVKPQDWGVLIPGFILLFIGAAFLADSLDFFWIQWYRIFRYWPAILIIIGLFLVVSQVLQDARKDKNKRRSHDYTGFTS